MKVPNDARLRAQLIVALTLVTGMTDAIGFTKLGGVFTSVMTGNMVLLGVAGAREDGAIAIHTAVAFAGYILGTYGGARVAGTAKPNQPVWPRQFSYALVVEFVVLGISTAVWESAGAHPSGHLSLALLGINAIALGIQSAAVLRLGVSGLSTTYLTGTLTNVVAHLTTRRSFKGLELPSAILAALIGGAAIGAVLALHAPVAAPIVLLATLGIAIAVGLWAFEESVAAPTVGSEPDQA